MMNEYFISPWWSLCAFVMPFLYLTAIHFNWIPRFSKFYCAMFDAIWLLSAIFTIMFGVIAYNKTMVDMERSDELNKIIQIKDGFKAYLRDQMDYELSLILREKNGYSSILLESIFYSFEKQKQDVDADKNVCMPTDTSHVVLYRIYRAINASIDSNSFELLNFDEIINSSVYLKYRDLSVDDELSKKTKLIVKDIEERVVGLQEAVKKIKDNYNKKFINNFSSYGKIIYWWYFFTLWLPFALGLRLIKSVEELHVSRLR